MKEREGGRQRLAGAGVVRGKRRWLVRVQLRSSHEVMTHVGVNREVRVDPTPDQPGFELTHIRYRDHLVLRAEEPEQWPQDAVRQSERSRISTLQLTGGEAVERRDNEVCPLG